MNINKVIFFTYGDSSSASTWSNVPFLFTKSLEDIGIKIYRVDLSSPKFLRRIYDKCIHPLIKLFFRDSLYTFNRTYLNEYIIYKRIQKNILKYNDADICIFTSFDYYNKFNAIPEVLFCDWTFQMLIEERHKRKPYFFERRFIKQQNEALKNAKKTVSLFPHTANVLKINYPDKEIHYFNTNVINNLCGYEWTDNEILNKKTRSNIILFIGSSKYLEGAKCLIRAFQILVRENSSLQLHIIGIQTNEICDVKTSSNIFCHGYLRKDIETENELYYKLLINAKVIVNPTPIWSGYSSIIEAMYFFTPVIICKYQDFSIEFGNDIDFGLYTNDEFNHEKLATDIDTLFKTESYDLMCKNAHEKVYNYTWDRYVFNILELFK